MLSTPLSISELFQQREQYLIPLFQRGYVWNLTDQIQPLWEDVVDRVETLKEYRENAQTIGEDKLRPLRKHFFGAIIVGSPISSGAQVNKVRAILETLELASSTYGKEFTLELDTLSVEHVLPQKWKPQDYPLSKDDAESRESRTRLLHCIGNLTLVTPGFNTALSNEAFKVKRPAIVAESRLALNAYFQAFSNNDVWDEKAIVARAEALYPLATRVWPYPASG